MDEHVPVDLLADQDAEPASRVEPFDPAGDLDGVRRDALLLGLTQDRMPNTSASASSGIGFGRLVGTRTHERTVTREEGFLKMNR